MRAEEFQFEATTNATRTTRIPRPQVAYFPGSSDDTMGQPGERRHLLFGMVDDGREPRDRTDAAPVSALSEPERVRSDCFFILLTSWRCGHSALIAAQQTTLVNSTLRESYTFDAISVKRRSPGTE